MKKQDLLKQQAAWHAVKSVQSGMVLGLGTGSTTNFAIRKIAERLKNGELTDIVGVPSSIKTELLARELQIPLSGLEETPRIDLTIDGADEVDSDLNLIKGGGGALLREKVLAQSSAQNIIIVDESKISEMLGENWALPIEVVPFALSTVQRFLEALSAEAPLRRDEEGKPFVTDQGNWIVDASMGPMVEARRIAETLNQRAGIVEHGLFIGLATKVVVATADGIREMEPPGK